MLNGITYVAIGDSITHTLASGENYPKKIYEYIKTNYMPIKYINKGIGGQDSTEMKDNSFWNSNFEAGLVTIGIGMNDCANGYIPLATYKSNIELIINKFRARNAFVKIILCTPSGTSDINRTPYIANYRIAMEEVATSNGCYLCKFHEAVTDVNIATYSGDGIHPNASGHTLLMDKLQPILDEIFG